MPVISVISSKGGVGKTTSAVAFLKVAVSLGKRCLLIDLDGQGNASNVLLGTEPRKTGAYDALSDLSGETSLASLVRPTKTPNAYCIAGDRRLEKLGKILDESFEPKSVLKDLLAPIRDKFDLIVMDCPPALGLVATNALVASDAFICPVDTSSFSIEALAIIEKTASLVRQHLNPKLHYLGAFICRTEKTHSKDFKEAMSQLSQFGKLMTTNVPASTKVPQAHRAGASVVDMFPEEKVSVAYKTLTKTILKECEK